VLRVIAAATALTLNDVLEEQRQRFRAGPRDDGLITSTPRIARPTSLWLQESAISPA